MTLQAQKLRAKTAWIQCIIFLGLWFAALVAISIPHLIYFGVFDTTTPPDFNSLKANSAYMLLGQFSSVLAVLAAVYIMRRILEKERVAFPWLKMNFKEFFQGSLLAFILIISSVAILYLSGLVELSFRELSVDLLTYLALFIMVAVHEEVLCRGYLLDTLDKAYGKFVGILVSTLIFTGLHIFNSHVGWIGLSNIFLSGVLMALFFLRGRNLWAAIGIHFAWNYAQGPILGFAVSGLSVQSLLEVEHLGNSMLTGSQFGLEGSLVTLAVLIVSILAYTLVYYRKNAKKLQPPQELQEAEVAVIQEMEEAQMS